MHRLYSLSTYVGQFALEPDMGYIFALHVAQQRSEIILLLHKVNTKWNTTLFVCCCRGHTPTLVESEKML